MDRLERFENEKWYKVIKGYTIPCEPRFRLKQSLYQINVGDVLKFVGKTLGYGVFQTKAGKRLYIDPKDAFKVIGAK